MIRHLLKLVWNRKRTNALLIVEIFFSFLVLFLVETCALFFWNNYRQPLGFSSADVWTVEIGMHEAGGGVPGAGQPDLWEPLQRVLQEVRSLPAVESVAASHLYPYANGSWTSGRDIGPGGRSVDWENETVTEDFARTLGLDVVAGRWFQKADAALAWDPVVLDRNLAREVFGGRDPIGQRLGEPAPGEREQRVIGVVSDYRKGGELSAPGNFLFTFAGPGSPVPARNLVLKVRPGTPAVFEEELVRRLQAVAPQWSFQAKPLAELRAASFRLRLIPLILGGVVAFFLLLMVGLGLIGVLWQNLLQRTWEIGLRRATGASSSAVHRQLVLEQLLLTTLGVLVGVVLAAQLQLLGVTRELSLSAGVFTGGLLLAAASIYLLAVLCVLYPSTMASRIEPAEALRYE
jgi:putative ABC transport system permease protein